MKKPKFEKKPNGKGWVMHISAADLKLSRDEFHFHHQLTTRMQIIESKKHKKARYKKDYRRDDWE